MGKGVVEFLDVFAEVEHLGFDLGDQLLGILVRRPGIFHVLDKGFHIIIYCLTYFPDGVTDTDTARVSLCYLVAAVFVKLPGFAMVATIIQEPTILEAGRGPLLASSLSGIPGWSVDFSRRLCGTAITIFKVI